MEQSALKGNGTWLTDWFEGKNARDTPLHNVTVSGGVSAGLGRGQNSECRTGTPPPICQTLNPRGFRVEGKVPPYDSREIGFDVGHVGA